MNPQKFEPFEYWVATVANKPLTHEYIEELHDSWTRLPHTSRLIWQDMARRDFARIIWNNMTIDEQTAFLNRRKPAIYLIYNVLLCLAIILMIFK
jgi:hypothetical protein